MKIHTSNTFSFENSFFHRPLHTLMELHNSMVEKKENKGNEKICISLPPAQLKAIDERRGLIPRSTFISELVDVVWVEMTDKKEKEEQT